jgi:hypothetical protein
MTDIEFSLLVNIDNNEANNFDQENDIIIDKILNPFQYVSRDC